MSEQGLESVLAAIGNGLDALTSARTGSAPANRVPKTADQLWGPKGSPDCEKLGLLIVQLAKHFIEYMVKEKASFDPSDVGFGLYQASG